MTFIKVIVAVEFLISIVDLQQSEDNYIKVSKYNAIM